ncbi:unnamed protein product [Diamesa hyperborea]
MLEKLKNPTDFTIDCILSKSDIKSERKVESPTKEITPYVLLNKVGENPWIPKSPYAYNGLIQKVHYYPNPPLIDQIYLRHVNQYNYMNSEPIDYCAKTNINYSPELDSVSSEIVEKFSSPSTITSSYSSNSPNPENTPNSYSPQLNVYDYSKFCDKFVLNSLTINLSGDKNQLGFSGESSLSSSPIINYDSNVANQKCSICSKVFDSLISLDIHEKSHLKQKYECSECNKKFSQLRNYKYHMSIHRGTKEFSASCPECGKIFNDKGYLSSHMKIHRNKKEYLCPYCPKSFNQRVAYNMHCRIHLGLKPHCCSECGKQFSRKMLLKQHFRTHSGEKPYSCSFAGCGKQFADRSNMILHYRLHSGIKPFACHLCPKAFTKKHHLKTHLNYHTGNKPYKCPYCPQKFTQSSNMRTHSKKCQFKTND